MNQDVIVDALGKHLDALQTIFNSIILLAVAIAWAGISRQTEIEALSMKFQRRHAFFIASGLYLIANIVVLTLFLRIGDLFLLLDGPHTSAGFSMLATHTWILNPFSYFGRTLYARLLSAGGPGLLIFTWWLCTASLITLDDKRHPFATKFIFGALNVLGFLSLSAILFDFETVAGQLEITDTIDRFRYTIIERMVGVLCGIGLGTLALKGIQRLYEGWTRPAPGDSAKSSDRAERPAK
ncbi:MAG TPA: hypothetical protein VII09_00120 [Opitutaceae bacterium]